MYQPIKSIPCENGVLTKREWDCVKLSLKGKSAKEVARVLGISHRTVEVYLSNAKRKFNSKNIMELLYKIGNLVNCSEGISLDGRDFL